MSFDATRWAWAQQDLSATEKLTLLCLANRANSLACCWPARSLIAKETGLSRATVTRTLKTLRDRKLVEIAGTRSAKVGKPVNVYQLPIDAIRAQCEPPDESKGLTMSPERAHSEPLKGSPRAIEPVREPVRNPSALSVDELFCRIRQAARNSNEAGKSEPEAITEAVRECIGGWTAAGRMSEHSWSGIYRKGLHAAYMRNLGSKKNVVSLH